MFRIITGNPGSGKSFYGVNYLFKFIQFDPIYKSLILDKDVLLITNIENIQVTHVSFQKWFDAGMLNYEKCKEYMLERNFKRAIMIVDESQNYFNGLKEQEIFYFFEMHRHIGMDIFLICHSVPDMPKRLIGLCEYIIEAVVRTKTLVGFQYNMLDKTTGKVMQRSVLRADQRVFSVYKSFEIDENSDAKPKKILRNKIILYAALLVILFGGVITSLKQGWFLSMPESAHAQQIKKSQNDTPEAGPGSPSTVPSDKEKITEKVLPKKDYVFVPDVQVNIKPGGNIKGISKTESGTYIFYK